VGLRLVGYDWPPDAAAGRAVTVATYWTFDEVPAATSGGETLYFDLLGARSGAVAQARGLALPRREWAAGLLLLQWNELSVEPEVPAGDYLLLVGAYGGPSPRWSRYVDPEGYDLGDGIPLGPVSLAAAGTVPGQSAASPAATPTSEVSPETMPTAAPTLAPQEAATVPPTEVAPVTPPEEPAVGPGEAPGGEPAGTPPAEAAPTTTPHPALEATDLPADNDAAYTTPADSSNDPYAVP
jgi:hypothetical protein